MCARQVSNNSTQNTFQRSHGNLIRLTTETDPDHKDTKTCGVLTLAYHMSQSERLQIITGTNAPQSLAHLGGQGNLIAQVPFPSPNYNHSTSPYTRPSDFKNNWDYWSWIKAMKKSIKEDNSINIPNHFTQFFSYIESYWKVFLGEWNICHQTFDTNTYTHRESTRHYHGHPIWGSTDWSISDCTVHPSIKNGLPLHRTTRHPCSLSQNDRDCRRGLYSPPWWSQSLWANDSSRDTWRSERDHQGTSHGLNDPPGTSLPDPAKKDKAENAKGKMGAAKKGSWLKEGIWVKGHAEGRSRLYVPPQFGGNTWQDIHVDQEWTIRWLVYQPVATAIDSTASIWYWWCSTNTMWLQCMYSWL